MKCPCLAAGAHLLRGDGGADVHVHSERVRAALEEVLRLALGDDVAADGLEDGELDEVREGVPEVVVPDAGGLLAPRRGCRHAALEEVLRLAVGGDVAPDGLEDGGTRRSARRRS